MVRSQHCFDKARSSVFTLNFIGLALLTSVATFGGEPVERSKADASADLRATFSEQDDTASRRSAQGLQLARRSLIPASGIESSLLGKSAGKGGSALVIMALDRFPSVDEWQTWRQQGITYLDYLGHRYWLIRVQDSVASFATTRATAFHEFRSSDKVAAELDAYAQHAEFFDAARHLVVVDLALMPDAPAGAAGRLRQQFHHSGVAHDDRTDGSNFLTLVTTPAQVDRLAMMDEVLSIRPGAWQAEVLLDGVRQVARAENVIGGDGDPLTGSGIRAATNERLGDFWVGKIHEGFWNHDANGNITTRRWTEVAEDEACGIYFPNKGSHGLMTAGILLGNGWFSGIYADDPLAFRGIAHEATLDCYSDTGARAHVSSHSYTGVTSSWDQHVLGGNERFHAHTAAIGNDGLDYGYFSIQNTSKNVMGVGNAQVNGEIHPTSSAGPTQGLDGRIKPDISAPTGTYNVQGDFTVDIQNIVIARGPKVVAKWNFSGNPPYLGWGQTQSGIGRGDVQVQQLHGLIKVYVEPLPWETWGGTPVVGTEVDSFGNPLNFVGHEQDVLKIVYRAYGLDYFDMKPVWFRDHPHVQPNCAVGDACPWYSQSHHGGIGIGDGQWRTLEVPIGKAGDWNMLGIHPFWDDDQTWAGESIQFLGLRFKSKHIQPTPSYSQYYNTGSGGSSGASPVVAGGYALAMENLTRLYEFIDLDDKTRRSIYYASDWTPPPFGMPLNSTWKALFVHTADDMIRTNPDPSLPPNPDTGVPNVYHAGPDYSTGYGMVDVQSAIDLMNSNAAEQPLYDVTEFELRPGGWHTYELPISDSYVAGDGGLKVTLAWDDAPGNGGDLVNNLGLLLQAPDDGKFYPWSLKVPELPVTASSIVPAQRDQPNDRDNLEQVVVDDIDITDSGVWKIYVIDNGMGNPGIVQKYSLIVSPWNVEGQCHACD